ncbi:MAG: DNA polymerase III subunit beta [Cytophagales bacterium]
MKFVVNSKSLLAQLNAISGVIVPNPIVPILENFLFEIDRDKLTVTASDLQMSMIAELQIDGKEKGNIAIQAKILLETLKNLAEQPVTFSIDENTYSVEIITDNGRYKIAGENATDFPKVPVVNKSYTIDISSNVLARAISSAIVAVSNDELRPNLCGIYVKFAENNTTFVATDGHKMVRFRRVDVVSDAETSIIVPKRAFELLRKSLPSENTNVRIEFNPSNAFFSFDNIKMICRLIDERYPEYENAIPRENPNVMQIDRGEFLSTLKRIDIYSNKTTNQIRLKLAGSELQISAEDFDFSNEANERLPCEYEGEDLEIGFNSKFLIQLLANMDCREIVLSLSQPNRAGLITPAENIEGEDQLMLVMPVMLNNYA